MGRGPDDEIAGIAGGLPVGLPVVADGVASAAVDVVAEFAAPSRVAITGRRSRAPNEHHAGDDVSTPHLRETLAKGRHSTPMAMRGTAVRT